MQVLTPRHQLLARFLRNTFVRHSFVLYALTFLVILPLACRDSKHSVFFSKWQSSDQAKEFTRQENDERLDKANRYFQARSTWDLLNVFKEIERDSKQNVNPKVIALTVITVSRNRHVVDSYQPKYLTQVVWKLLSLVEENKAIINSYGYIFKVSICNVDFDPNSYAEVKELEEFMHVFHRFSQMHFAIEHPFEKEKQDYVFCMNASLQMQPDFVFLLEDDALPRDDFYPVVLHTIHTHVRHSDDQSYDHNIHGQQSIPQKMAISRTAYVKLYHPERLSIFHIQDPVAIVELVSLTAFSGTILHVLYIHLHKSPNVSTLMSWSGFCVYALLTCLAISRPSLLELRRHLWSPQLYSYLPAPSCCTPALLFPSSSASTIVTYLNAATCSRNFGKDSVLDNFLRDTGLRAYLVQPNVVTHIGMYSALRRNIVDPFLM